MMVGLASCARRRSAERGLLSADPSQHESSRERCSEADNLRPNWHEGAEYLEEARYLVGDCCVELESNFNRCSGRASFICRVHRTQQMGGGPPLIRGVDVVIRDLVNRKGSDRGGVLAGHSAWKVHGSVAKRSARRKIPSQIWNREL